MSDEQNKIVGVIGRKGSGKSTRAHKLIQYAPRILIFDPMADHIKPHGIWDPNVFAATYDLGGFFKQVRRTPTFASVLVPDDLETAFDAACDLAYRHGNMLFVIEEAPLICQAGYMPPTFGKLVRTGRHRNIDLLWTAQRAAEVSRTLTSMTDCFVFYSQTEPRDLDAIAGRCGRDIADEVARLGLHDSFTWDVVNREIIPDSPRLLKREIPNNGDDEKAR